MLNAFYFPLKYWSGKELRFILLNAGAFFLCRFFSASLAIQGLTSSGGGSSVGADEGNSCGVSRALVKDRLIMS